MKRFLASFFVALLLVAGGASVPSDLARAQDSTPTVISGHLVDGTEGVPFDPTKIAVTLNVFEGVSSLDPTSVQPSTDGSFSFAVDFNSNRTYFLSVEYQGATYSATVPNDNPSDPLDLTVYEATSDPSVLDIANYSIIVTGAVPSEGWIEILERASIFNDSGRTLVPNLSAQGPAMLNFLRFGLPAGAYNLDVQSTVVGGQILTVDKGFALTTPIPPTQDNPHQFEFVYRLPYSGDSLDLSRPMPFGADAVRYVAPADVGRPGSTELQDLGATELNGRFLRLLEGQSIAPGDVLDLSLTEIVQPRWYQRIGVYAGDWYVRYVVPGFLIVALALLWFVVYRRHRMVPAINLSADPESSKRALLDRLAELDSDRESGRLSTRSYETAREQIRRALVDLRLAESATGQFEGR